MQDQTMCILASVSVMEIVKTCSVGESTVGSSVTKVTNVTEMLMQEITKINCQSSIKMKDNYKTLRRKQPGYTQHELVKGVRGFERMIEHRTL